MIDKKEFVYIINAMLEQYEYESELNEIHHKHHINHDAATYHINSYELAIDKLFEYACGSYNMAEAAHEYVYNGNGAVKVFIHDEEVPLDTPELLYDWMHNAV